MSQTNSSRQNQLIAIGGFVVGASAAAVVFASYGAVTREGREDPSSRIRGSSSRPSSLLPIAESGADGSFGGGDADDASGGVDGTASSSARPAKIFQAISLNATALATHVGGGASSSDVADLISSVNAAANRGNVVPSTDPLVGTDSSTTYSPTADVKFPTLMPTEAESASLPMSTSFPTYSPTAYAEFPTFTPTEINLFSPRFAPKKRTYSGLYRLKLHWEEGYFWQENVNEKWWCMACENEVCEVGTKMWLRDCKEKDDELDALFAITSYGYLGDQFRVSGTDLCLQKMGSRRAITLRSCRLPNRNSFNLQLFEGFKPYGKFDLRPNNAPDRCLSNHHHPKAKEIVYAETCVKAHRPDTGYWVAY